MTPRTKCLDAATLAALAAGTMPAEAMRDVQTHLPECSQCLGIVAATVRERARVVGAAGMGDTVVIERPVKVRQGPVQLLAVLMSFLALGSSVAWWHLGAAVDSHPTEQGEERAALRAVPRATVTPPSEPANHFVHVGDAGAPGPDQAAGSQMRSPRIAPIFAERADAAPTHEQSTSAQTDGVTKMRPSSDPREQPDKRHPSDAEREPEHIDIAGRRIRTTL